jgi:hypothetical protein
VDETSPPGGHEPDETAAPAYQSFFFLAGSPGEAAYFAALREQHGDELADRLQRLRARGGQPRPLTGDERVRLRESLAPVLHDAEASGAILPAIQEEAYADVGDESVSVMAWGSGGSGMGLFIPTERLAGERVARLAEQVQEWEVEELAAAGRSATWPECPDHRKSHPLEPVVAADGWAVWRCPRAGRVICAIGALGASGS